MSTARKILSNTFSQVVGKALTALLAVIVVKILATYLGKAGYGEYATIYEFLAFFGAAADLGLFTIAVREMASPHEDHRKIFQNTLTLRTILTTFAMGLAVLAAFLIPAYNTTHIPQGVIIAGIATWFVILSGTVSTILQVKLKMGYQALGLVLGKIITVVLIVLITQVFYPQATDEGFYALLWAGVAGSAFTFGLTAYYAHRFTPVRFAFDRETAKKLLMEATPFGIALILNTIYFRLDIVMFSVILPYSVDGECAAAFCADTEAGSYAVAVRMLEVLIIIPLFFMNSVLPALTRRIQSAATDLRTTMSYSFYFLFATGLAGALGIFALARPIVTMISSEKFLTAGGAYGSDTALKILMPAMFFTFLTSFFGFALIAFGKQKKLLWINFIAVLFNLFSNLWAIPRYGLRGAATTSYISEGLIFLMGLWALGKITKEFRPDSKVLLKITFAAVVMAFFVHYAWGILQAVVSASLGLLIIIPLAMALFFGLLRLTGALTGEMLALLRKKS